MFIYAETYYTLFNYKHLSSSYGLDLKQFKMIFDDKHRSSEETE